MKLACDECDRFVLGDDTAHVIDMSAVVLGLTLVFCSRCWPAVRVEMLGEFKRRGLDAEFA